MAGKNKIHSKDKSKLLFQLLFSTKTISCDTRIELNFWAFAILLNTFFTWSKSSFVSCRLKKFEIIPLLKDYISSFCFRATACINESVLLEGQSQTRVVSGIDCLAVYFKRLMLLLWMYMYSCAVAMCVRCVQRFSCEALTCFCSRGCGPGHPHSC